MVRWNARSPLLALTFALGGALSAAAVQAQSAPRPRISSASELPAFSYPISGTVEALVRADTAQAAKALRAALRRDIESVLHSYDIADSGLVRSLKGTLMAIAILEGRDDEALRLIDERRALATKVGQRLLDGLEARAFVEAHRASRDLASPVYAAEVARLLTASLLALPFDSVQNDLRQAKSGLAFVTDGMLAGALKRDVQPLVDKEGALPFRIARQLVGDMYGFKFDLAFKPVLLAAYDSVLAGRTIASKPDIWAARSVTLTPADRPAAVRIGIWDSGLDTTLFAGQLARDSRGRALVIAYDRHFQRTDTPMAVLPPALLSRRDEMSRLFRGLGDLDANMDTPDARYTRDRMATLSADSIALYTDWQDQWNGYSHGTVVTSVAVAGNPAARVVLGRMEFSSSAIPDPCPSRANAEREAAMLVRIARFFAEQKVRVVNMSWGRPESGFLGELERCAAAMPSPERAAIARYAVDTLRRAMTGAMRASPDILFVAAAGNAGNNTAFNDFALRIDLPNMLIVGAVDRAGDEVSFTNTGPLVRLYANGYLVETIAPGGGTEQSSGTSFAAPAVVNTVSKMLAVQPGLTTDALMAILIRTADVQGSRGIRLLNPAKAVAEARAFNPR